MLTNDELSKLVDTSDEWITERTGIKERHVAEPEQAASDLALPAARQALEQAGIDPAELDLVVVATVTPDMFFPSTGSLLASELGAPDAAAYDLSAGCTGFMYALAQAYGTVAGGLARNALVVGAETLSKIINWHDRSTCVLFGDGAGAVVIERVPDGGFLGFELGSDGEGGKELSIPAGGSRNPSSAETVAQEMHFLQMNGREVYKFATRVLVSSAEKLLDEIGLDGGRHRPLRAAPGEQADHRPRGVEARHPGGEGLRERRPLREHVLGFDPALPGAGRGRGAADERDPRAHDRHGRRAHVGIGVHRLG